jgi:hypothetical protein
VFLLWYMYIAAALTHGVSPTQPDLRKVGWNDKIGSFKVLQIPGPNCLGDLDSNPQIDPLTDCYHCCNGCNLSGSGCCPPGASC